MQLWQLVKSAAGRDLCTLPDPSGVVRALNRLRSVLRPQGAVDNFAGPPILSWNDRRRNVGHP
jgi:hypothetical protein